jgi:hypothetical protein
LLERIRNEADGEVLAQCEAGRRACPPEDVGGIGGYAAFLEAIEDTDHPEYEEKASWIGCDFDPDSFDARLANLRLCLLQQAIEEMSATIIE